VDTQTETVIQTAMAEVMKGRTSIVIAQRLSTVKNADKIVVLKDGKVAEEGTHDQLYALGGEYRTLYDLQFRDQEERDVISDEIEAIKDEGATTTVEEKEREAVTA
jgi:ATP-binding cassette subfamily B protein